MKILPIEKEYVGSAAEETRRKIFLKTKNELLFLWHLMRITHTKTR
jgi:hypothetical protein